ncbi:hypothetical protein NDU88_005132 [Pleurodeles waltl]|uniref:Uncharacterized protein n=1 Tax=Pleurodeles waltl TaxID=8319 RepID=A0AAV7TUH0_PLEWA|nr:hypothetical protein NDU88_005132 [Pleurodeles waltl]
MGPSLYPKKDPVTRSPVRGDGFVNWYIPCNQYDPTKHAPDNNVITLQQQLAVEVLPVNQTLPAVNSGPPREQLLGSKGVTPEAAVGRSKAWALQGKNQSGQLFVVSIQA